MIFNMVGGGSGGALNMKISIGTASVSNRNLTVTGLTFRPIAILVRHSSGTDSRQRFFYANREGVWWRFGSRTIVGYPDVSATVTSNSITINTSDTTNSFYECDYLVMGFEE